MPEVVALVPVRLLDRLELALSYLPQTAAQEFSGVVSELSALLAVDWESLQRTGAPALDEDRAEVPLSGW